MCLVTTDCWRVGPAVGGVLGGVYSLDVSDSDLQSSTTTYHDFWRTLGALKVIEGQLLFNSDGIVLDKGFVGAGAEVSFGYQRCTVTTFYGE